MSSVRVCAKTSRAMADIIAESSARFYQLVHELLGSPSTERGAERRRHVRRPFPTVQRIAPSEGSSFPDADQFIPVICHDLTEGGFSFVMPTSPPFAMLVAELRGRKRPIYLLSQVQRVTQVALCSTGRIVALDPRAPAGPQRREEAEGIPMVLVGCRFLKRLRKPVLPSAAAR